MNIKNPTVALHVTEKELAIIIDRVGYSTRYTTLGEKLTAAHTEMRKAKTLKNRAQKLARRAKAAATKGVMA